MKFKLVFLTILLLLVVAQAKADMTGSIEADHTINSSSANVEGRLGYQADFGSFSIVPFLSLETELSQPQSDNQLLSVGQPGYGAGLTLQSHFEQVYLYVDTRAMRFKAHNEYRLELGGGYQFENGIQLGGETTVSQENKQAGTDDMQDIFAVIGYEFTSGYSVYIKMGRALTIEAESTQAARWQGQSVLGVKFIF